MDMYGVYKDIVASIRDPLMGADEVAEKWGEGYGSLVGRVLLPGRDNMEQKSDDPAFIEDQNLRTLMVFDARESFHSAPHFIVASLNGLTKAAAERGRFGQLTGPHHDIQHVYEGERLEVGTDAGRWLPRDLARHENGHHRHSGGHQDRKVIAGKQTTFYVGEDGELHVYSEGYNASTFVGYPNSAETAYKDEKRDYERAMREQIAEGRRTRAAEVAGAVTTNMSPPVAATGRSDRHAQGARHAHTAARV